ncbi:MAG TPA: pyrroline-5-carboxylate reductase [Actinomycetota bacterium]|jgi:pyrroline-5-carboxylate reductase|nr:pyrroline-5-carboxylate reductase [Actinomycetota bacterium]
MTKRLAIVGAGMMGEALARGLLDEDWSAADLILADVVQSRLDEVGKALGCETTTDALEAATEAEGVVLAVKPQDASGALDRIAGALGEGGLVSIVAGLRITSLEEQLGGRPSVVRAMPNTPARVGKGVTALAPGRFAADATRELADSIFTSVGPVVWLEEEKLDAVTALSGSGPAYVFLVAEAMVDAGVALGLPRDVAETLAFATIEGSGSMLRETGEPPAVLRAQVTSPGGTTAAALAVLEAMAVRAAFGEALRAAHRRSQELGS